MKLSHEIIKIVKITFAELPSQSENMNYIQSPNKRLISVGDICVIYISDHNRHILKIQTNVQLQTKFGLIKAVDLVNHPYGVRFEIKRGWVLPLRLTPEFWTQLLPHRTQILYQADISMILLQLDIKPGSVVVESGTGSGSLSHVILRACRPNGFLYTYDINESRVAEARREFKEHGFEDNVRITNKNVCLDGFCEDLVEKVDAVLLDLPQTWEAIDKAFKVMKSFGSKICTFSPCIEQVQQNVAVMNRLKMKDIITLETLLRPLEVRVQNLRVWEDETMEDLTAIDKKRFENLKEGLNFTKRAKLTYQSSMEKFTEKAGNNSGESNDNLNALKRAISDPKAPFHPHMLPKTSYTHVRQLSETVSHSGYLTFATKRP